MANLEKRCETNKAEQIYLYDVYSYVHTWHGGGLGEMEVHCVGL